MFDPVTPNHGSWTSSILGTPEMYASKKAKIRPEETPNSKPGLNALFNLDYLI